MSEAEKVQRRAATKRLRALRDRLPSIAPDSSTQYIRETRAEADDVPDTDAAIVVDASVAAKWLLRDESSVAEADKLLDRYDAGALVLLAPQQIEIEVANAIRKAVLNGRVTTQAGNRHLEEWLGPVCARFRPIPNGWLLPQAFSCSLALSVTLFDALYRAGRGARS